MNPAIGFRFPAFSLLLGIALFTLQVSASPLIHSSISNQRDCFSGPFASYDSWTEGLKKHKPGFTMARFPFTRVQFEQYHKLLTCQWFTYDVGGVSVDGFVLYPNNAQAPLPSVIFNRGGNTSFGSMNFGLMMYWLMPLAKAGFVVIGSQYRGASFRGKPDEFKADGTMDEFGGADVNDVVALVDILKTLKVADASKLGLFGVSRGGMQSFLAASRLPQTRAIVTLTGLTDAFAFRDRDAKARFLLSKLIPDYEQQEESVLRARSPYLWAEKLPQAPVLIIHAKDDERVDVADAQKMANALSAQGIPHELVLYDEGGHMLNGHNEEVTERVISWLKQNLDSPAKSSAASAPVNPAPDE